MSSFSRLNKGYKYLLTVINVFSKYGGIVPLETKTGKDVVPAFRKLFLGNTAPSRLWTDKGTEFYNQQLQAVLAANNVTLYSTENEEKSSIVERWKRMMKNIMWKYLAANNTQKYIEKYNNTYHRSIKLAPSDACIPANYQHVHNTLYGKVNARKATSPKFHVGDKLCITLKVHLRKDLHPIGQKRSLPIAVCKLLNRQRIPSRISWENQCKGPSISKSCNKVHKKKKNQVFVQWKGYSNKFNSWVPFCLAVG